MLLLAIFINVVQDGDLDRGLLGRCLYHTGREQMTPTITTTVHKSRLVALAFGLAALGACTVGKPTKGLDGRADFVGQMEACSDDDDCLNDNVCGMVTGVGEDICTTPCDYGEDLYGDACIEGWECVPRSDDCQDPGCPGQCDCEQTTGDCYDDADNNCNGLVDEPEECETAETCGNGTVNQGEECDPGDEFGPACNADCTFPCGDGVVSAGETCDPLNDETCRDDCTKCGDEVKDVSEECDGGADCTVECTYAACGDGIVSEIAGETCEPTGDETGCNGSNCHPDDGQCRNDCTMCGDGIVQEDAGETCDDGLPAGQTQCAPHCQCGCVGCCS